MTTTTAASPPVASGTMLNDLWYDDGNGNLRSQCVGVMTWQPAGGLTGWTGSHASFIASPQSPYLLLATADGTGTSGWYVTSPSLPAVPGDTASASCPVLVPDPFDVPVNLAAVYVGVAWLDSGGAVISVTESTPAAVNVGATAALTVTATGAPVGTVSAAVVVGDGEDSAAGTQMFAGPAALAVWSPFQVGTNAIANAAVTPTQVASGAVTAGAVAAGAIDGMSINAVTINGSTITAADVLISGSQGGLFVYSSGGTVTQTLTGSGSWTCPAGVTSVLAECWGGGAGGGAGGGGGRAIGGGGGEYAAEPSLAVTPGNSYAYTTGAAGSGGTGGGSGGNGGNSTFAGDSVTVTAHGGLGTGSGTGPGGSGSGNTVHFAGGNGNTGIGTTGGGGGGSGGTSSAGNSGGAPTGGAAVPGGGPGGNGGTFSGSGSAPSSGPGGGGGGPAGSASGGAGFHGKVRITYTSASPALIGSIAGAAGTSDPVAGVAYPEGVASDHVTLTTVTAVPAAPSLGCVLYYKSGALWALGPSGTPVSLATT